MNPLLRSLHTKRTPPPQAWSADSGGVFDETELCLERDAEKAEEYENRLKDIDVLGNIGNEGQKLVEYGHDDVCSF